MKELDVFGEALGDPTRPLLASLLSFFLSLLFLSLSFVSFSLFCFFFSLLFLFVFVKFVFKYFCFFLLVIGGDSLRNKVKLIKHLITRVNAIIIAGGPAFTFKKVFFFWFFLEFLILLLFYYYL